MTREELAVGQRVLVKSPHDGSWYEGLVIAIDEDDARPVRVRFSRTCYAAKHSECDFAEGSRE